MKKAFLIRRVVGNSMLPMLRPGQLVIATGLFRQLGPEVVIVFRHNKLEKIKRIQRIKDNQIFVIGDNPRASLDSRSFGCLPIASVVGKVIWPRR